MLSIANSDRKLGTIDKYLMLFRCVTFSDHIKQTVHFPAHVFSSGTERVSKETTFNERLSLSRF